MRGNGLLSLEWLLMGSLNDDVEHSERQSVVVYCFLNSTNEKST